MIILNISNIELIEYYFIVLRFDFVLPCLHEFFTWASINI